MKTKLRFRKKAARPGGRVLLRRAIVAMSLLMCGPVARAADTNEVTTATDVTAASEPAAAAAVTSTNEVTTATAGEAAATSEGAKDSEAAATNAVAELTPEQMFEGGENTYVNWVELGVGGLMKTSGSEAQAQQRFQSRTGAFGGIQDLHFQEAVDKKTTFTLDGRGIFDNDDYKLRLGVTREDLGYLRLSYEQFRTWYNGAGGYWPPAKLQYNLKNDDLALDRGQLSFEAGLRMKDLPKVTFKYTHRYREGDKSSTIWGPVHTPDTGVTRGLYPSITEVDEKADIFQLDVAHHIKLTDFGGGVRLETGHVNDSRRMTFWSGEPVERKVADREDSSYDSFSAHAFSETWFKDDLMFSAGFLFGNTDSRMSGNRVYGADYDVNSPPDPLNGLGYNDLTGTAHSTEYVGNLNLMYKPISHLTIIPSVRFNVRELDANSHGTSTYGTTSGTFESDSSQNIWDIRERLDARYNGVTNWVFYGGGEWVEGGGNLKENGGFSRVTNPGPDPIQRNTDDDRWFQKYTVGARWYPARVLTADVGGYYKFNKYNYNHIQDSTPNDATSGNRYPAYLTMQNFSTYDGFIRLVYRPLEKVTLSGRYEYQESQIETQPAGVSGLDAITSSRMYTHVLGGNVSWIPITRLWVAVGGNYVISKTTTPANPGSGLTPQQTSTLLQAQNNYWTVDSNIGVVVDPKTDLQLGYFYYQASDYTGSPQEGLPLGAGASEHGASAMLTRRISEQVRLTVRGVYSHYHDWASGGHNDYDALLVSSSIQYRF